MSKIFGLYNDDEILVNSAKSLVAKGVKITDIYSPFPVHGIEKVVGIKWTRIAIAAFIYGCTGLALSLLGLWFFMVHDWPLNIGGKPNFALYQNIPAFIPIIFEFTVFCTAHGMALTYLLRNWTLPGIAPRNPDPRTTDDHFAVEIEPEKNNKFSKDDIHAMLQETGAVEVFEK